MKYIFSLTALVIFTLYSFSAKSADLDNLPKTFQVAKANGVEFVKHFKTDTGLDGWLVKASGEYNVWFSDKDGFAFIGAYLSPEGENLTANYLEKYAPKPDYAAMLSDATVISTHPNNPSKTPVYVFYEPHCGFCSAFHAAAEPYIKAGAEVRWVPVAFLRTESSADKPSSLELVARILNSPDPVKTLDLHETKKAQPSSKNGLKDGAPVDDNIMKIVKKNSGIMAKMGFSGTPAIVYMDDSGKYRLIKGFPQMAQMPALFRKTRMDAPDKRLIRFGAQPETYPVP